MDLLDLLMCLSLLGVLCTLVRLGHKLDRLLLILDDEEDADAPTDLRAYYTA